VGLLHTAFGLIVYREGWTRIGGIGIWNSVDGDLQREHAFWFTVFGPAVLLLGAILRWLGTQSGLRLPRFVGLSLLVFAAATCLLMPVSGFWLIWPPALALLRAER
jgi:hypothetical protein